ncbi:MAG: saccharopine dehydrogenase NADP-binding domain-containing protein [bacterium]|jgi:NAD(P)-dependent dehydrogenase (short-subunit alcohol dehydrogenase family)
MKILLLGAAGYIGRAAAVLLARRDEIGELILVDYDIRNAKGLAKALSPKCRWAMADVGKPLELSRLLEGIDAVAGAVGPCAEYEKTVLLTCGAGGIAVATIGEGTIAEEDRREIDGVFRNAGVPAVIGCGMMPGWTELLAAHFLGAGDAASNPPMAMDGQVPRQAGMPPPQEPRPAPEARYLFFSPAKFGGYTFLRAIAQGITGPAAAPPGAPAGTYFALSDGSRIGVPGGKAGTWMGRVMSTIGKLGPVGKEFSAALLLWMRAGMKEPAGTPVAVAGVASGDRFARLEDPEGRLAAELLSETVVRLAARPRKATGLLALPELIGRWEAEVIASRNGARIVS